MSSNVADLLHVVAALAAHANDSKSGGWKVNPPKIPEPIWRQSHVANRGHDRAVAEIGLDGASVMAVVGELESADVSQHVGMNEEGEFRGHAGPGHHALISGFRPPFLFYGTDGVPGAIAVRSSATHP